MIQSRRRSIMEVRSSRPHAVERRRLIALAERVGVLFSTRRQHVPGKPASLIVLDCLFRESVEAVGIRTNRLQRHDLVGIVAVGTVGAMTLGTSLLKDDLASSRH